MSKQDEDPMRIRLKWLAAAGLAFEGWRRLRRSRTMDLSGCAVAILGGSRGLGLVLAREYAARGARVAVCSRDADELKRVEEEFAGSGRELLAVQCDIAVQTQVRDFLRQV